MYVNFDAAAATIILSLNSLNTQLQQTDTELSTGNAVNSPADNPVLWAEASATESYAAAWGAVANEIGGVDSPVLTTATGALSSVLSTLGDMKTTIEDVQADSDDAVAGLATLKEYGQTLTDTVDDAVAPNGENLLDGSTATVSFVDGYNQTGGVQSATFTTKALIKGDDSILQAAQAGGSATATDLTKL
ncbi:MAG: flagellin [Roseiarcus sp.]